MTQAWSADVPGLSVMYTGCAATGWVLNILVRSQVVWGVQGSRRAVVVAGERSGSMMHAWSTDVLGLSVIQAVNQKAIWIGFGDGAQSQHWQMGLHRPGSGELYGMRGNGVGFTDINRIHTYRSGV